MRIKPLLLISLCLCVLCSVSRALADTSIGSFSLSKQNHTLHVEAEATDASVWANTQLMIDVDADPKTGCHLADQAGYGFDVMIEGTIVYRFQGDDPTAWSWKSVGQATRQIDGKRIKIDVDPSLLNFVPGSTSAKVLLRGLSGDYQKVLAASSISTVDLRASGSDASAAPPTEPAANPSAAPLTATATQDGTDLVLNITAKRPADLDTLLIFFDTDRDDKTGFLPPADPHFGFEEVIQGTSLSQHIGATRDGWTWAPLATVKQTVTGNTQTLRFNASLLKSTKFRMAVWQMSPDWQARTDIFPHDAPSTIEVNLDASKLHSDATVFDPPLAPRHANADFPPRDRFKQITSYCCFYGAGKVAALSHYDAAILHIPAETPADVKKLSSLGVVTIGYLSVGEDETLQVGNGKGPGGYASWYFDRNHTGKPERNGIWGSYFANAADPNWRHACVAQAKRLCGTAEGEYGFDGIFLDTIESVDAYPQSRDGMIQLVADLREALPDKVIVINRGFSLLAEPKISSKIDGLMYESFTESYDFDSKSYIRFAPQDMDATRNVMVSTVLPAMKKYGLRALALDYMEPGQTDRIQEAFDRAVTYGMVPAVAPISLDAVYNTSSVVAHADPKYLAQMATPQSMQITMDAQRNGFPAGTIVQPSSCFLGYTIATIVDGKRDHRGLTWSKAAWASAEQPNQSQQVMFTFPHPLTGGTLKITFAFDNTQWHPSKNFRVEVMQSTGGWKTIASPKDQLEPTFTCPLPAESFRALRIVQEPGGGSPNRPNLMWLEQVERVPS